MARFGDALPRDGGLEDQDSWLLQGVAVLRAEEEIVRQVVQHETVERQRRQKR